MRSYATLSKCRSPATSGACEGNEGALLLRTAHREILGELLMKYFLHDRPPACARGWRVRTPELACARPGCQRRGGARGGDPDIRRNHLFDAWAPGPLARFHAQDSVGPGRNTLEKWRRGRPGGAHHAAAPALPTWKAMLVAPSARPPRRCPYAGTATSSFCAAAESCAAWSTAAWLAPTSSVRRSSSTRSPCETVA